jgi:hypothetical protein
MMAVYVEIRKETETTTGFIYRYVAFDGSVGRLEIDKCDGITRPISIAIGDVSGRSYALAARKLLKHFQAGEFPDETCWAS